MRVRDLPELDRPRERLLRSGAQALSDRELLALLLGSGLPGTDVIELAAKVIEDAGGLRSLAVADPHALRQQSGVGTAKAARVAAAFELARRALTEGERRRITGSSDVAQIAAPYLRGRRHERVVVVVCDSSGGVLRVAPLTDGAADRSLIPVRDVLSAVLAVGGTRFAVAHNHPSGSVEPSAADTEVTSRLRAAAETVGLRFLDHVIVTETEWGRVS
jgi:DNA repair protein RadC